MKKRVSVILLLMLAPALCLSAAAMATVRLLEVENETTECEHENTYFAPNGDETHNQICNDCSEVLDENLPCKIEEHEGQNQTIQTSNGKGHTGTYCSDCYYAPGDGAAHEYEKDGSCKVCLFTPILSDSEGNLYDKAYYQDAFEKAANSDGAVTLTLVSKVTGAGANIWTKTIEFDYPGKSVTLNMDGITLVSSSSTGEAALIVSSGELIIADAAALEGADGVAENPAAPAVKVTGGALTFKGTVTATGGSGNNSAAPAIEVSGGKVTFGGAVNATGGLQGYALNTKTCQPAIKATGGELAFNGDLDLNGGLTITGDATLKNKLTQGTFRVEYYYKDGEDTKKRVGE